MKTNDKDIEKMAVRHAELAIDSRPKIAWVLQDVRDAYKAGFKACEAMMLESAASSFEEWFGFNTQLSIEEAQPVFTAGAMSQAKRDAERIKELEEALNWIAFDEIYQGESTAKNGYACRKVARAALKQGGEK